MPHLDTASGLRAYTTQVGRKPGRVTLRYDARCSCHDRNQFPGKRPEWPRQAGWPKPKSTTGATAGRENGRSHAGDVSRTPPCTAVHEPMRLLYSRLGSSPGLGHATDPVLGGACHSTPLSPPHHDRDEHDTSQKGEEFQGNCPGKSRRSSALGAAVGKSPPRSEMR